MWLFEVLNIVNATITALNLDAREDERRNGSTVIVYDRGIESVSVRFRGCL